MEKKRDIYFIYIHSKKASFPHFFLFFLILKINNFKRISVIQIFNNIILIFQNYVGY